MVQRNRVTDPARRRLPGGRATPIWEAASRSRRSCRTRASLVEAIEAGLDAAALNAAIGRLEFTDLLIYLPRFEFEFGAIKLENTALQAMGMADAFDPERANFAGMVDCTPHRDPNRSAMRCTKAFISVDEESTEAAAA